MLRASCNLRFAGTRGRAGWVYGWINGITAPPPGANQCGKAQVNGKPIYRADSPLSASSKAPKEGRRNREERHAALPASILVASPLPNAMFSDSLRGEIVGVSFAPPQKKQKTESWQLEIQKEVLAQRNPTLTLLKCGTTLLRLAQRALLRLLSHEPPRTTRSFILFLSLRPSSTRYG